MADKALAALNKRLPEGLEMRWVKLSDLENAPKNARFMRNEVFTRLVDNIRKDGALESVPLCGDIDGKLRVLSGNHRVQAAIAAGIDESMVLVRTDISSRSEEIAKQLSHNAVVGEDDPQALHELYEEIADLDWQEYSGLDDNAFGDLPNVQLTALSEAQLEYQTVTFVFLPEELERVEKAFAAFRELAGNNEVYMARWSEYDRLLDRLALLGKQKKIHNTAAALMYLLDHLDEVYTDGTPADERESSGEEPPFQGG